MIRIDEIYCNTFLPLVQDRPCHGLHWFDPFGSVKFENLQSTPPVPWNDGAVRYLFWDQEPLHRHTVDHTLGQFKKMYNGKHHLITSEYCSEMVDYVVSTYDFVPHYYFFHGWAALDWFRGYDRSFLMRPPDQRTISKTFIMPNRIIAGQRQHRLLMLYHIFKNHIKHAWISCPAVCPVENISTIDVAKTMMGRYPDIVNVFSQQSLPLNFPNESGHPMHSNQLSLFDQCAESLLYLVTETVANGRKQHLTEKIFKPICLGMPFIVIGCAGSLEYLRSYGFKTFSTFWDESYDTETDDYKRIEKIAMVLRELDNTSQREKQQIFDQAKSICEHNRNHFYSGSFEKILWNELTKMIEKF